MIFIKHATFMVLCLSLFLAQAQPELPYRQIPNYPMEYTLGSVAARLIDGLGYRYYWATEGLRPIDLAFKPQLEARSSRETLEHIYTLSLMILNAAKNQVNEKRDASQLDGEALRAATLNQLHQASQLMLAVEDLGQHNIRYDGSDGGRSFPFWNVLNGPLEDAVYHTGQIVSFRRTSGNPMNPKVNVLMGKTE
jgi:uncharacterized damage-inducible protein DinB|tara:strand:+ start:1640 stop:2221 length:582 start_codon:yes stop_codon:yes gene_type:complete